MFTIIINITTPPHQRPCHPRAWRSFAKKNARPAPFFGHGWQYCHQYCYQDQCHCRCRAACALRFLIVSAFSTSLRLHWAACCCESLRSRCIPLLAVEGVLSQREFQREEALNECFPWWLCGWVRNTSRRQCRTRINTGTRTMDRTIWPMLPGVGQEVVGSW